MKTHRPSCLIRFPANAFAFTVLFLGAAAVARADYFADLEAGTLDVGQGAYFTGIDGIPAIEVGDTSWLDGDTYQQGTFYIGNISSPTAAIETYYDDILFELNGNFTLTDSYGDNPIVFNPGNQSVTFDDGLQIQDSFETLVISGSYDNITLNPDSQNITFSTGFTIDSTAIAKLNALPDAANIIVFPGDGAFFVGNGANATGYRSAAFGGSANATGNSAVALAGGNAVGDLSLAAGSNMTANAWGSVVLGHDGVNIAGNNSTWLSTDAAFVVGIGNSSTPANGLVVLNNGILYSGSGNATADGTTGLPQGDGARLMWIPQKSSFFVGTPTDWTYGNNVSQWDYGNIGVGAVAIGNNITVTGNGTVAMGAYSFTMASSGGYSTGGVAIGNDTLARGKGTVAMGESSQVDLNNSATYYTVRGGGVAIGEGDVSYGTGGVSAGAVSDAFYDGSVAMGNYAGTGGWEYASSLGNSTGAVGMGEHSVSVGVGAIAMGYYAQDFIYYSGNNTYSPRGGQGSVSLGYENLPFGTGAVSIGSTVTSTGNGTLGIGNGTTANGTGAIALGNATSATGNGTMAIGNNVTVTADGSAALGSNLTVDTDHALVAGQWAGNGSTVISGSGNTSVLFALGNGTSNTTMSNAFTVLKNGDTAITGNASIGGNTTNTTISGNVTLSQRQGDIYMGSFTNITADQAP